MFLVKYCSIILVLLLLLTGCWDQKPAETEKKKQPKKPPVAANRKVLRKKEGGSFSNAYGKQLKPTDGGKSHIAPLPSDVMIGVSKATVKDEQETDEELNKIKIQSTGLKKWNEKK